MKESPEQRRWPRRPLPSYWIGFEQIACRGQGEMIDLSIGGLALRTMDKIEPGAVTLRFKQPPAAGARPSRTATPVTVHGEIVWIDAARYTCGIAFHLY